MQLTALQRWWKRIGEELGLDLDIPFTLELTNFNVEALVLVKNFGASRGMILVTDFRAVSDVHDELIDRGYGYSTLSEPTNEKENVDADDLEAAIDMLRDWGWSGTGDPPEWY